MGNHFTMIRYYHEYQEAAIKASRAKADLDKLKSSLQFNLDSDTLADLMTQIEAAQEKYDEAREAEEKAWYLSTTGQTKEQATASVEWHDAVGFKGF